MRYQFLKNNVYNIHRFKLFYWPYNLIYVLSCVEFSLSKFLKNLLVMIDDFGMNIRSIVPYLFYFSLEKYYLCSVSWNYLEFYDKF
jgi:hypothetical protein